MTDEKIDSRLCSVCNGTGLKKNVPCGFCGAKGSVPSWVAEAYERNHKGSNRITQKDEPMTDKEEIKQLAIEVEQIAESLESRLGPPPGDDTSYGPVIPDPLLRRTISVLKQVRAYELGARPQEREFPQEGDTYYVIRPDGQVVPGKWRFYEMQREQLTQGEVFPSKEAAQREARRREVKARIAAIDAEFKPESHSNYLFKKGSAWGMYRIDVPADVAGAVVVHSELAAKHVLAEIPVEDLDLLTMEPEFVPSKL